MALLSISSDTFRVAYGEGDKREELASVLEGAEPRDFHWALLTIPEPLVTMDKLTKGVVFDLKLATGLTFTQVYRDVCNPALQNFDACWIFEDYQTGMQGLSGTVVLQSDEKNITGSIDLTWQGMTDRFGEPSQWHKHGTLSDFSVPAGGAQ